MIIQKAVTDALKLGVSRAPLHAEI